MRFELTTSSLPRKCSTPELQQPVRNQTHLFQKSETSNVGSGGFEPPKSKDSGFTVRPIWPLWKLPVHISMQILMIEMQNYFFEKAIIKLQHRRASGGIRTPDQLITNQLLWPTELHWQSPIKSLNELSKSAYLYKGIFLGRQR